MALGGLTFSLDNFKTKFNFILMEQNNPFREYFPVLYFLLFHLIELHSSLGYPDILTECLEAG